MPTVTAILATGAVIGACITGTLCMGADSVPVRPPVPAVTMPGDKFQPWEQTTNWTRTYYVDGQSAQASDQNPGDAAKPFKTINHVAQILQPGERVVVRPGIYRECVRPARGGSSPEAMIGYHADQGGPVIIRGSDVAPAKWTRLPDNVWELDLSLLKLGDDDNPLLEENLSQKALDGMPWAAPVRNDPIFAQPRGMVFQDGARLKRVDDLAQVTRTAASHWTDRAGKRLLVHPSNGRDPNTVAMELTTRQAAFRPAMRGLGFIEIKGFTIEYIGNGFPRPQEGAISTCGGHHFLIEGNTVRDVNGIGIDIGNGWYGSDLPSPERGRPAAQYTVVRLNRVERTGVCGIAGIPAINALIERNTLINNTLYSITRLQETAGIKTHTNTGTLIRQNLILRNPDNGIWMDFNNRGSRCTQNVIVDCQRGIFLEASVNEPFNMVDRNVIFRATTGIYEHDSWKQTFVHNLICDSKTGIRLQGTVTERVVAGTRVSAGGHTIAGNLILTAEKPISERKMPGFPANTIMDNAVSPRGVSAMLDSAGGTLRLTGLEALKAFCQQERITHDLLSRPWPADNHTPGPLPQSGVYKIGPATP